MLKSHSAQHEFHKYRGADKSLAQSTSRCVLFDGENILFDASLVIYIYVFIHSVFCLTTGPKPPLK